MRKRFPEDQAACPRIISAQRTAHLFMAGDVDPDTQPCGQVIDQTARQIGGAQQCLGPEVSRGDLKRLEIVGAVMKEIPRLLGREQQTAAAGEAIGGESRHPRDERLRIFPGGLIGPVEFNYGPRRMRCRGRQFLDFLPNNLMPVQDGIGEHLPQRNAHAVGIIPGKFLHLEAKMLGYLQQERHRHRSLIMFDEVEITRGNRKIAGQVLLGQTAVGPQTPDLSAQSGGFGHGIVSRKPRSLSISEDAAMLRRTGIGVQVVYKIYFVRNLQTTIYRHLRRNCLCGLGFHEGGR